LYNIIFSFQPVFFGIFQKSEQMYVIKVKRAWAFSNLVSVIRQQLTVAEPVEA
jgi:hypothetical protein